MDRRHRAQRVRRRHDRLEASPVRDAHSEPLNQLVWGSGEPPRLGLARPRVRLPGDDHERAALSDRSRYDPRPRAPQAPRAAPLSEILVRELGADHRVERREHGGEPRRVALERAERVHDRLQRRHTLRPRLPSDAVLTRALGRERVPRQARHPRVDAHELLGQRPRPVDDDQGDGAGRGLDREILRARPGPQQHRRPLLVLEGATDRGVLVELGADHDLSVWQAGGGHARRADRHELFPRVLQEQHARRRLELRHVRAPAHLPGPSAAPAHLARLSLGDLHLRRILPHERIRRCPVRPSSPTPP